MSARDEVASIPFDDRDGFDRWLAAHDAGVRAQTLRDAADRADDVLDSLGRDWVGLAWWVIDWLRAEADRVSVSGVVQGDAKLSGNSGIEKEQSQ